MLAEIGPLYRELIFMIPLWLVTTAFLGLVVWMVVGRFLPGEISFSEGLGKWFLGSVRGTREWILLAAGVTSLVVVSDFQGFERGFFRFDDFALIQDARGRYAVSEYLGLYHNDHVLPLFRAQIAMLLAIGGPGADSVRLASLFNGLAVLTFVGVILSGCWSLAALRVCRLATGLFCVFLWMWPSWGEFTAGFYTLLIYPQTIAFGFIGFGAVVRAVQHGSFKWYGLALCSAVVAALVDVSGLWVVVVQVAFCWLNGRETHKANATVLLGGIAILAVLLALYHGRWATHPFSASELVQNPSGLSVRGSVMANFRDFWWRMPTDMISGIGGTAWSAVFPPAGEIAAKYASTSSLVWSAFFGLELTLLGGFCALAIFRRNALTSSDWQVLAVVAVAVVTQVSMVVLARSAAMHLPGTLWPAKYKCVAYAWLVFGLAFFMDRAFLRRPGCGRTEVRLALVAMCLGLWMIPSHWWFEKRLALTSPWLPGGRYHGVQMAVARRVDFDALNAEFRELAAALGKYDLIVPPPRPDGVVFPFLEYGTHATLGSNYSFSDLFSINPNNQRYQVRVAQMPDVPREDLNALRQSQRLAKLFDLQ